MSKYTAIPEETAKMPSIQIPDGTYTARIYKILDLGTQPNTFDETKPDQRRFMFYFETPTKKASFNADKGEQPFSLSKELTFTISGEDTPVDKQSTLSKIFKAIDGSNGKGKNIFSLIGQLLSIQTSINSKGYAQIVGFAPFNSDLDGKDKKFAQVNDSVELYLEPSVYGVEEHNLIESQPDFLKEKIKASPEYQICKEAFDKKVGVDVDSVNVPF